ncbi:C protein [Phocine morbillivirus]|uniref:Protein C n=2 Tax=Phocine distemper virus TaxID=11240 RepID=C_PHODV|nr:C protein [Phocine morbillivirus]P35940.1 RecName: Full=Protein C [Phocine morbillivirus]AGL33558.1 C protein [Phocine morbillivirus]BAA01204.1 C protein [Phocine morbillivirus]
MSVKGWSASRPSEKILLTWKRFKRSATSGIKPTSQAKKAEPQVCKRKKSLRISMNHTRQQRDQTVSAMYSKKIREVERTILHLWRQKTVLKRIPKQDLQYDVIMFMITAVKRLRESKMLTVSWYQQALQVIGDSKEEREALMIALKILAKIIPKEMLHLTGDILLALTQTEQLM